MQNFKELRIGLLLSILSIVYGFGLGATFGVFESNIKSHLSSQAQSVLRTVYLGDQKKADSVADKSWTYFKRAHLHANGIGTTAMVLILLLPSLSAPLLIKKFTAFSLGFGALFYSLCWMLAGLKAPALGSTDSAKEALIWLAMPSVTLACAGVLVVLFFIVKDLFMRSKK